MLNYSSSCSWTMAMRHWSAFHHISCDAAVSDEHRCSAYFFFVEVRARHCAAASAALVEGSRADCILQICSPCVQVSPRVCTCMYLTDELCQVADVEACQQLRSSSSSSLIVSRTWLSTVGDRAFPVAAARVWNSLPDLVTSAPSVAVFQSRLKTHLFDIFYPYDCTVPAQWCLVALDTIIVLPYLLTSTFF